MLTPMEYQHNCQFAIYQITEIYQFKQRQGNANKTPGFGIFSHPPKQTRKDHMGKNRIRRLRLFSRFVTGRYPSFNSSILGFRFLFFFSFFQRGKEGKREMKLSELNQAASSYSWKSLEDYLPCRYASYAQESTIAEQQPNQETPLLAFFWKLKEFPHNINCRLLNQKNGSCKELPELTQFLALVNHKVPMMVHAQRKGQRSRARIERTAILPQKRPYLCCQPKSLKCNNI